MKIKSEINIIRFFCFIFTYTFILFFNGNLNSQTVKKDTIYHTPFDTNKIYNSYLLDNKSDTIGLQEFIWSDRKNLSEILNDKAGYFINYLGIGGSNIINFNNFDKYQIGILRDGVQVNNIYSQGFDIENISVSEIQKIEAVSTISSFLYSPYSSGKSLNIITKDAFQPTLFSQLRYSQDRYGALFADFSLNIPFSKKVNFIFGINSHFYDGYYRNSDFNVWRGRFKLNFYTSPKLNIKLSFYHTKINRRLNGGLVYNTNDTLKNANYANVYSLGRYERYSNYYSDITFTGNFFDNKNSLTRLIFYTNNSYRILRNGENGIDTGVNLKSNFHYIQYGADITQYINHKISKLIETNLMIGGNIYYDLSNLSVPGLPPYTPDYVPQSYRNNYYSLKSKLDVKIDRLILSGSFRTDHSNSKFFGSAGFEAKYGIIIENEYDFVLKGGVNSTSTPVTSSKFYNEFGFETRYRNFYIDAYQYDWGYNYNNKYSISLNNGNYSLKWLLKYFDFSLNISYSSDTLFPKLYLKSDVVYHNFFFNNKLDLKLGISLKYFTNTPIYNYDPENNYILSQSNIEKNFFNMDFYVGARIGTANINITVANIFDNVNYTTAIYPNDARGGFLNSIARFSIVWDFNR